MFLAGVLWRYTGAWMVWSAVPVCILLAEGWKEQGMRRLLLLLLPPVLFAAGALKTESEQQFRRAYLQELKDGENLRLVGEISRIEVKQRCVYYYLTDCVMDRSNEYVPCNDVLAYMSADEYSIGQTLVVKGTISLFEPARNEGNFDAALYYQSRKIDFGVWVDAVESVHGTGSPYRMLLAHIRQRLSESMLSCGDEDGILSAMLLGEKSGLDAEIKSLYQQAGISHILAISGLHVSFLGMGLYRLLRKCGLRYASACALAAVLMASYCVMTGGSVSSKRAVGMLFVYLLADFLGRGYDMLSALGLMCILLLWENPFLVGYSGFVFSMTAVIGVGVAGAVLSDWAQSFREQDKQRKGIWDTVWVSLGIQLTTLPLVCVYYYEIPTYAVFMNLVVPALARYVFGLGSAAAAAGVWSVSLGSMLMMPCSWILHLYEWMCACALALPKAQVITGCPSGGRITAYYVLLGVVLFVMQRRAVVRVRQSECLRQMEDKQLCEYRQVSECGRQMERVQPPRCSGFIGMTAFGVSVSVLLAILLIRPTDRAELDILDVGQGDGIYLCTADGVSVFIDGGSSDVSEVGNYRILPFLKYKGVGQIDYWFVSHTDKDHISGLEEALASGYPIRHLVFARAVQDEEKTRALAAQAQACGTAVCYMETGDALVTGSAKIECIYPAKENSFSDDVNAQSLVLQLTDREFSALFTGDISAEAESELLKNGMCRPVTLLKAAHHGSKYSNSAAFLQALCPKISVISCGENNSYGHPGEEALANMRAAGAIIYTTMDGGRIRICYREGYPAAEERLPR